MAFSTFAGPLRSGTVQSGNGRNTGLATLIQSTVVNMNGVALTAAAQPQVIARLPAGSKILHINIERTVVIAGNGVTNVGVTVGTAASQSAYMTSVNTSLTVGILSPITVHAAMVLPAIDNVGVDDVVVTATFTAATGNPTSGQVVMGIEYVQRAPNGASNPAGT